MAITLELGSDTEAWIEVQSRLRNISPSALVVAMMNGVVVRDRPPENNPQVQAVIQRWREEAVAAGRTVPATPLATSPEVIGRKLIPSPPTTAGSS